MKRITKLLAVLLCAVLLTGCGGNMKQPPVNVEQSGVAEETKDVATQSEEAAAGDAVESTSDEVEESTAESTEESAEEKLFFKDTSAGAKLFLSVNFKRYRQGEEATGSGDGSLGVCSVWSE